MRLGGVVICVLLVLAVAAPVTLVGAQDATKVPRIGVLSPFSAAATSVWQEAFRQSLRDLAVNLKTAKALRVAIPQSLLLRAVHVIE